MLESTGKLYVCATPIGNLEDITLRALRVLKEVQVIAAEDTRRTRKLLSHYDIHTPLISYHRHNERSRASGLLEKLKNGDDIAIVSDAGTPGISDPGQKIIGMAVEAGIPVIPVPGPSAVIAALTVTGYNSDVFAFWGFVPRKGRQLRQLLDDLAKWPHTAVLYETPHRLLSTLQVFAEQMPNRPMAICRELTKVHEEIRVGLPAELVGYFGHVAPQGEFVLVLSPATVHQQQESWKGESPVVDSTEDGRPSMMTSGQSLSATIKEAVLGTMAKGVDKKNAIRQVAMDYGLPRRQVYRMSIDIPALGPVTDGPGNAPDEQERNKEG